MSQRGKPGQCEAVLGDVRCGRPLPHSGKHSARVNMEWVSDGLSLAQPGMPGHRSTLVQFVMYIGYGSRRIRAIIQEVRL